MDEPEEMTKLSDRDFRFATEQYCIFADRITAQQKEREVWIRHSIIATFGFFGWIAVYHDRVTDTFMLGMLQVQAIYFLPLVFNAGGALRFFFIQREIDRMANYLIHMERNILGLCDAVCNGPNGAGIRDRNWHLPTISYWVFIVLLSGMAALTLILQA